MTRFGGNWLPFIEAAQAPAGDDAEWVERMMHAITPHFPGARSTWVGLMNHEGAPATLESGLARTSKPELQFAFELARGGLKSKEAFTAFYSPAHIATTHTEIERGISAEASAFTRGFREMLGVGDVIGLITHPAPGEILCMGAVVDDPTSFTGAERVVLTRAALHFEAAYRLRKNPDVVKAVLDADGQVVERFGDVPELGKRVSTKSLELWPALVEGRLSLVARGAGRKRQLLLLENDPTSQRFRALSRLEIDALRHAARGLSVKLTGYALGISEARVSVALASASAKVGAASRLELVRLGALLTRDPRLEAEESKRPPLSASEREVLGLLREGLSNDAIARMRGRSVRTVANQVAALLRKTGSSSRRELASRTD